MHLLSLIPVTIAMTLLALVYPAGAYPQLLTRQVKHEVWMRCAQLMITLVQCVLLGWLLCRFRLLRAAVRWLQYEYQFVRGATRERGQSGIGVSAKALWCLRLPLTNVWQSIALNGAYSECHLGISYENVVLSGWRWMEPT